MKKLLALTLCAATTAAFAANTTMPQAAAANAQYAKAASLNGLYVGGDLGYAVIFSPNNFLYQAALGSAPRNIGSFGWGLSAGYQRQFNPTSGWLWGVELNYTDFGQSTYGDSVLFPGLNESGKIASNAVTGSLSLRYVTQGGFNIFGKLGVAYATQTQSGSIVGYSVPSRSKSSWEPAFDAGLGYIPAHNLNLVVGTRTMFGSSSADTTNPFINDLTPPSVSLAILSYVGVNYTFNA